MGLGLRSGLGVFREMGQVLLDPAPTTGLDLGLGGGGVRRSQTVSRVSYRTGWPAAVAVVPAAGAAVALAAPVPAAAAVPAVAAVAPVAPVPAVPVPVAHVPVPVPAVPIPVAPALASEARWGLGLNFFSNEGGSKRGGVFGAGFRAGFGGVPGSGLLVVAADSGHWCAD